MSSRQKINALGILLMFLALACNLPILGDAASNGDSGESDSSSSSDGDNGESGDTGNGDSSNGESSGENGSSETEDEAATNTPEPPTAEPTDDTVRVSVSQATNCRNGPRKEHDLTTIVYDGDVVEAVARPPGSEPYLVVQTSSGECWLWLQYATVTGNTNNLPVRAIPPTPTPVPNGSIQGVVWLDLCSSGAPGDPPPGCLEGDPNVYYGNGILDLGEGGIKGVVVDLGVGPCGSTGYATATTDADGSYYFGNLASGTYCISINVFSHSNENDLIPGGWTHPMLGGGYAQIEVYVGPGEDVVHKHFGWDFQLD